MGADDWPLMRREPEFAAVRAALTGQGGVGKTTLARDVAGSLPNRVRWVAGTASSRGIPLGSFTYLVGAGTTRDPTAFLAAAIRQEAVRRAGRAGARRPVEGLSADAMWGDSGGNALLRHLVEGAVEAGTLRQVRGIWQLRGRAAVSEELASLVDEQLGALLPAADAAAQAAEMFRARAVACTRRR